jgi:Na+/H+ antiporter NhaD/arsenite permease-like protein
VANLIVVEEARASGFQIGFLDYRRVGVPITIVTLFVGWLVLITLPA